MLFSNNDSGRERGSGSGPGSGSGSSSSSPAARLVQSLRENKATSIERYQAFAVTRAYLVEKSAPHAGREATRRLGEALGYNTNKGGFLEKFERHRNEYNTLLRPVPFAYLDAIGADRDEIEVCLEADLERYHEEVEKPRFPTSGAIRYMPTIYGSVRFPLGTTEAEAIRIIQDAQYERFMRFIVYLGLLSIRIPEGVEAEPEYSWFPPQWTWKKRRLEVKPVPGAFGVARVG